MITTNPNQVSDGLALLIAQFKDKPKIAAFLTSWLTQVQLIENTLADLLTLRAIDTATGAQLDGIGSIVNLARGGLSDTLYRAALRVRFLIMASSGTIEDVISVVAAFGYYVEIHEGTIAEFYAELAFDELTLEEATQLASFIKGARAAGVYAYFAYATSEGSGGPFFSFGPAADVEGDSFGFDNGAFIGSIVS